MSEGIGLQEIRISVAEPGTAILVFCIEADGTVRIFSAKTKINPEPGSTITYLEAPEPPLVASRDEVEKVAFSTSS